MKIGFICNQNLARSQILSALLSQLLVEHQFYSYGLIAKEGSALPIVVDSIFGDWGLDSSGRHARNLSLHWEEVSEMDCIFALTTFIAGQVRDLGFDGEIVNLEEHAKMLGIEVKDPQLMPRRQCAYELAKYVKVAISAFQLRDLIKSLPGSRVYMPENEREIGRAFDLAIAESDSDGAILFADLIAPQALPKTELGREVLRFKLDSSSSTIQTPESSPVGKILVPRSAAMWPAKVYIGASWLRFLGHFSSNDLAIITPPIKSSEGKFAESYLAAMYGENTQIVGTP